MNKLSISTSLFENYDNDSNFQKQFSLHMTKISKLLNIDNFSSVKGREVKKNILQLQLALNQIENRFNLNKSMNYSFHAGNWCLNVNQKVSQLSEVKNKSVNLSILSDLINVLSLKGTDTLINIDMF